MSLAQCSRNIHLPRWSLFPLPMDGRLMAGWGTPERGLDSHGSRLQTERSLALPVLPAKWALCKASLVDQTTTPTAQNGKQLHVGFSGHADASMPMRTTLASVTELSASLWLLSAQSTQSFASNRHCPNHHVRGCSRSKGKERKCGSRAASSSEGLVQFNLALQVLFCLALVKTHTPPRMNVDSIQAPRAYIPTS